MSAATGETNGGVTVVRLASDVTSSPREKRNLGFPMGCRVDVGFDRAKVGSISPSPSLSVFFSQPNVRECMGRSV